MHVFILSTILALTVLGVVIHDCIEEHDVPSENLVMMLYLLAFAGAVVQTIKMLEIGVNL